MATQIITSNSQSNYLYIEFLSFLIFKCTILMKEAASRPVLKLCFLIFFIYLYFLFKTILIEEILFFDALYYQSNSNNFFCWLNCWDLENTFIYLFYSQTYLNGNHWFPSNYIFPVTESNERNWCNNSYYCIDVGCWFNQLLVVKVIDCTSILMICCRL